MLNDAPWLSFAGQSRLGTYGTSEKPARFDVI
jgi:hypothetical protein